MKIKNLEDLCFACPDGTIGVIAGYSCAEFSCKTKRDQEFLYRNAGKIGCFVKVKKPLNLIIGWLINN